MTPNSISLGGYRMTYIMKIFFLIYVFLIFTSATLIQNSFAAECSNSWERPSFINMKRSGESYSLTEYKNNERYLLIQIPGKTMEIYYLKDVVLVKGMRSDEIKKAAIGNLSTPLRVPLSILRQAASKGPCSLDKIKPFSFKPREHLGTQSQEITNVDGEIISASPGNVEYSFNAKIDPPGKFVSGISYSGKLDYSTKKSLPINDIEVRDYTVVMNNRPFMSVGSSSLPVKTLGQLINFIDISTVMAKEVNSERLAISYIYPLKVGKKYGYVDKEAQVIINPQYDWAQIFRGNIAIVKIDGKQTCINKYGKIVVEPKYEDMRHYMNNLIEVKENGKWGLIDDLGHLIVEPQYDIISRFKGDIAAVKKNGKWGYINKAGSVIVEPQFAEVRKHVGEDLVAVQKNGQWGFINKEGHLIVDLQFDTVKDFKNGAALVMKMGKWGLINTSGHIIIEPHFDEAAYFSRNVMFAKTNGKWCLVDKSNRISMESQFDAVGDSIEGVALVKKNDKWGTINESGQFITKPIFDSVGSFKDGIAEIKKDGKSGFIDRKGLILVAPQFEDVDYRIVMAKIKKDGKWGYMNSSGKIIIEPTFRSMGDFIDGVSHFQRADGSCGYIDNTGQIIIERKKDDGDWWKCGFYIFGNDYAEAKITYDKGLIDRFAALRDTTYDIALIDLSGVIFARTDTVCGQTVVKNAQGQITWPKNVKSFCQ